MRRRCRGWSLFFAAISFNDRRIGETDNRFFSAN
jgi:hypothetical protein